MTIKIKCRNCKKEFEAYNYTKGRKKYCSKKCMEIYRHTSVKDMILERIEKVDNGCWLWKGSVGSNGYGKINNKGQHLSAHRASYTVFKGAIPKGKHVCHSCDIRTCVNPDHLWIGTQRDNIQDMIEKGRKAPQKGKNIKWSKDIVEKAIALKNEGKTYVEVHDITGIPIGTLSAYVNGNRRSYIGAKSLNDIH